MEGEALQGILVLSQVVLQPQGRRGAYSVVPQGLQMLGDRVGVGVAEEGRGVLADAEVAPMTQSLCPFTVGLGAQAFLSWRNGGFKLENDSFFLHFDQQRGKYFTGQGGGRGNVPPGLLGGVCVSAARAERNRTLIKTHSKLGPVGNEYALLFATEISFQHLICLQIP